MFECPLYYQILVSHSKDTVCIRDTLDHEFLSLKNKYRKYCSTNISNQPSSSNKLKINFDSAPQIIMKCHIYIIHIVQGLRAKKLTTSKWVEPNPYNKFIIRSYHDHLNTSYCSGKDYSSVLSYIKKCQGRLSSKEAS